MDYTRKDIAKLLDVSYRNVMLMCQSGELPVKHYLVHMNGNRPTMFYDKDEIDAWLPNAPKKRPPQYRGRARSKVKDATGITFKDVFAGKYLPHKERLQNFSRLAMAQASRPKTERVSFKGVY